MLKSVLGRIADEEAREPGMADRTQNYQVDLLLASQHGKHKVCVAFDQMHLMVHVLQGGFVKKVVKLVFVPLALFENTGIHVLFLHVSQRCF